MAGRITRYSKLVLGWLLVVAGLAALVLPGPGLLTLAAGLALLSTEYAWARRHVDRVKAAAVRTAIEGVRDVWRLCVSGLGVAFLTACGLLWIIHPPVPSWWPVSDFWWLPGGWATGATLLLSAVLSLALVIYSYRTYRTEAKAEAASDAHA